MEYVTKEINQIGQESEDQNLIKNREHPLDAPFFQNGVVDWGEEFMLKKSIKNNKFVL